MEIMHVAHATAHGGREGYVETDDGVLKLRLAAPESTAVTPGNANPEQLFACAYAACFGSALAFVAEQQKITLERPEVRADVALDKDSQGFFLAITLNVSLPGLAPDAAEKLVEAAHGVCPYSKALRGTTGITSNIFQTALPERIFIQPEHKEI